MITDIIAQDPTSIVVTRYTKVQNVGGFSWTPTTLAAQTVRLYQWTSRNQREATLPEGETKQIILGILALPTADFIFSHSSYDVFTDNGRTYRIVGVRKYDDLTIDPCVECDCVAV